MENEVADVRLNVPWAQQAEKKTQLPGCQKNIIQLMKIVILNFFVTHLSVSTVAISGNTGFELYWFVRP